MTKAFAGLMTAVLAVGVLSTASFGAPMKKAAKMAATLKCPACGMMMPSHKTAATPVAVPIKGHTYYCCASCAAGKAHMKGAKKKA